jgi:hypothetical protein
MYARNWLYCDKVVDKNTDCPIYSTFRALIARIFDLFFSTKGGLDSVFGVLTEMLSRTMETFK